MAADPGAIPVPAVLKAVSRSFFLSIRFLPAATRRPVAVAYLLARAADSVADTPHLPVARRLECLRSLREIYESPVAATTFLPADVVARQELAGERALLERLAECLAAYRELDAGDRDLVRDVLRTLTGGMLDDLTRFPNAGAAPGAFDTRAELDRYCYSVAGVVGEFWSRIHVRRLPSMAGAPLDALVAEGVRFGKGLQLVNVLRDLPRDLRRGRCYLPLEDLRPLGLGPADLLAPASWPKLRRVVESFLEVAFEHLQAGLRYLRLLPARERMLRLTCWWPLAIGVETLGRIRRAENLLDPAGRVKVAKRSVYYSIATGLVLGASDRRVAGRFAALARSAGFGTVEA